MPRKLLSKCVLFRNREKMHYFNVSMLVMKYIDMLIFHKTTFLIGIVFQIIFAVFASTH